MRQWIVRGALAWLILGLAPWVFADTQTVTKTVTVNTNLTDTTIVAGIAGAKIYVTSIAFQNAGFTTPINVKLCDGACASATQILGPFLLSPGSLGKSAGGTWGPDACALDRCIFKMTAGNALMAQADMGQLNNAVVMVTFYYSYGE